MTKDDLQRFCAGKDEPRYYLRQPWSAGEYSYATNGHIIVRVPKFADVPENNMAPDAIKLFETTPVKDWVPVPACEKPSDVDCDHCRGTGTIRVSRYRNEDCEWCEDTGKVENTVGMDVGDSHFQVRYLAMIQGWEIAPNGQAAAWIRKGDASGLLMPLRRD